MEFTLFNLIAFFIGIIIGATIIYQISKDKIENILSEEKSSNHYKDKGFLFKYIALVEVLKNSKGGYLSESKKNCTEYIIKINNLTKKLEECQLDHDNKLKEHHNIPAKKNTNLDNQIGEKIIPKENDTDSIIHPTTIDKTKPKTEEIKNPETTTYFSIPDTDGSFQFKNGDNKKNNNAFFSIIDKENSDQGTLNYISGELDIRAIDAVDHYLLPVCDIKNIENRDNACQIEMIAPGEVFRKEDQWIIDPDHKVKIKFS